MQRNALGNTGLLVTALGFGAAPLGQVYGEQTPATAERSVHAALDHGINFFDVSPYYGETLAESVLGNALVGRRDEVVLATKCGRYGLDHFDFSAARVRSSAEESLRRLRTDRLDLLQAHDIEFADLEQIVHETIPAMRQLQSEGKIRAVGITGYPPALLRKVAQRAPVDSILSYCHYTLLGTSLMDELAPFAQQSSLGLINASPLCMGLLTNAGPPPWHPAAPALRALAQQVAELCRQFGADVSSIALHYSLGCPAAASTLCGMRTENEVVANLQALEREPPPGLLEAVHRLVADSGVRTTWPSGRDEAHA